MKDDDFPPIESSGPSLSMWLFTFLVASIFLTKQQKHEIEMEKVKERMQVEKEIERTLNEGKTANPFLLSTAHVKFIYRLSSS